MKWSNYYPTYLEHFPKKPKTIVEIGVREGDGLVWLHEHYPDARLIGIDIDCRPCRRGQWELIEANQARLTPEMLDRIGSADIIIDDGSHQPNHQAASFKKLWPLLNDRGVYAIEDLYFNSRLRCKLYGMFFGIDKILRNMVAGMSKWEGLDKPVIRNPLAVMYFPQLVLVKKGEQYIYPA